MKKLMFGLMMVLAVIMLTGCSSLSDLTKALAKDPASATAKVTSIYGTAQIARVGVLQPGQTATVTTDGTIKITYPGPVPVKTVAPAKVKVVAPVVPVAPKASVPAVTKKVSK